MIHYQTTTDKVLALIPKIAPTESQVGGIILPDDFKPKRPKGSSPIIELVAHSAGPDCKTVKAGDRFLYNINHGEAILYGDTGFYILPEGQILAVVSDRVDEKKAIQVLSGPLTIEEIRTGLGMNTDEKMPEEPPAKNA